MKNIVITEGSIVSECVWHMCQWGISGDQKAMVLSQVPPSFFTWAPGIKFMSSECHCQAASAFTSEPSCQTSQSFLIGRPIGCVSEFLLTTVSPSTLLSYSLYAFHAAQWGFSLPYLRKHPWKNRIAITSPGYFDYTSYVFAFKEDGYRARALTISHELQHTSRANTELRIIQGFLLAFWPQTMSLPAFLWSWFWRK